MNIKEHKKLERLMLFSEVAQHLSFTLAANSLGISRGHLSAQVKQLEKDLGTPLLIRSTRSVRLSAEGQRVLESMEQIRRSLLELERNVEHEGQAIEGVLKITAPAQFTERFLLDICDKFKQLHPQISFSIDCSYQSYDLNRSDFDMAFRATNEPPQNMIAKPLFSYRHACVASPSYLERYGKPEHPSELGKHQCLSGQDFQIWPFEGVDVPLTGWMQLNDNHMLKKLAIQGQGIIRVPDYLVYEEIGEGLLTPVLTDFMPTGRTIYIIHPQLIHQSRKLNAFIEFTRAYFD